MTIVKFTIVMVLDVVKNFNALEHVYIYPKIKYLF